MKKQLFILLVILGFGNLFAQLTLEHSYESNDFGRFLYKDDSNTNYGILRDEKIIDIYDENHQLFKSVTAPVPDGYQFFGEINLNPEYQISKYVFNEDEKLELILPFTNGNEYITIIFNEDGEIIHEFGDEYWWYYTIFHDNVSNRNKFIISKSEDFWITEVYLLPTSELTTKEIQSKNELSAYPIPANSNFTIINPNNGENKVELFDMNGALILSQNFNTSDKKITLDVAFLPKGVYVYKIGSYQSKLIKK